MVGRRMAVLSAVLAIAVAQMPARADEYSLESQLQFGIRANDNIKLSTTNEEEVVGGILSPQLKFGYQNDTTDISLTGRTDLNGYVVNSDLSSVDNRAIFHSGYRSERGYLALDADFNRDTIFENVEDNDVEFVGEARVTSISVSPSYSYQLSALDQLEFTAGFLDRSYSSDEGSLTDYQYYTAGVDWSHDVTERDTFTAGTSYGRYEPEGSDSEESDIINLSLGWEHDFSPNFNVAVAAGPTWISSPGDDDLGYNVNVRATYEIDEQLTFTTTYTLQTEPSSRGRVTENRSRLAASLDYELTQRLTLRMAGNYVGKETGSSSDTSSYTLQPSLIWQVSQQTDLSASYQYRHKTTDNPSDEASSNAVMVTLTYRPDRWTWSN